MTCPWDPDEPTTDQEIDLGLIELERWLSTATATPTASSPPPTAAPAAGNKAAPEHGANNAPASSNVTPTAGADNPAPKSTTSHKARRK